MLRALLAAALLAIPVDAGAVPITWRFDLAATNVADPERLAEGARFSIWIEFDSEAPDLAPLFPTGGSFAIDSVVARFVDSQATLFGFSDNPRFGDPNLSISPDRFHFFFPNAVRAYSNQSILLGDAVGLPFLFTADVAPVDPPPLEIFQRVSLSGTGLLPINSASDPQVWRAVVGRRHIIFAPRLLSLTRVPEPALAPLLGAAAFAVRRRRRT